MATRLVRRERSKEELVLIVAGKALWAFHWQEATNATNGGGIST